MLAINVIGGGLAGCEAAYYIAESGIKVRLWE
ncbi:MAG: FAD-dependent oxidoreductase, partial [Syntrophomonas sp.]